MLYCTCMCVYTVFVCYSILAFNRGFLALLHSRMTSWTAQQSIGDLFLGMVCYLVLLLTLALGIYFISNGFVIIVIF